MIDDKHILDLIPKGKENKISSSELEALTGATPRTLKAAISRLRQSGVFICSSVYSGGYYQPKNKQELAAWVNTETMRINTHNAAIAPAKKHLKGGIVTDNEKEYS